VFGPVSQLFVKIVWETLDVEDGHGITFRLLLYSSIMEALFYQVNVHHF
jgi:hypothetical protein